MKGSSGFERLINKIRNDGLKGPDGLGKKAVDNHSGLEVFRYAYTGSVRGGSYSYSIKKENEKTVFVFLSDNFRDYGEMRSEVSSEIIDELNKLYLSLRLAEWDGFDKTDTRVLDGSSFSLDLKFADGKTMSAGGCNAFPNNYREFKEKMEKIMQPLCEEAKEKMRRKKISEGIHGTLSMIMMTFIGKGASGRDEYHVLISRTGIRSPNLEVRIRSVSGEFFPEGEYSFYRDVPDETLNMAAVQEMAERYNIINWYNFNQVAEDPNNTEWYQLNLSFGDEMKLSSMGTEHPENYDSFRHDFLSWLAETVRKAEKMQ